MSNLILSCLNICGMMPNTKICWSDSPFTRYTSVKMTVFAQKHSFCLFHWSVYFDLTRLCAMCEWITVLMSNLNLSCLNICGMMANTKIFWSNSPFTRYMSVKMTLFAQNTVSVFFTETCISTSRVYVLRENG